MIQVEEKTRKKINAAAEKVEAFSGLTTEFGKTLGEGEDGACALRTQLLNTRAKSIREGDFKILVCGRFKTGKSTFVNALLESDTMVTKATACTAVIAVVSKGNDGQKVKVEFTDGNSNEMSLDQFKIEYQLTAEEQQKIDEAYEKGTDVILDRFAPVDHSDMQSMQPMFESGCSLIDSPGLEEALSRDKTTNEFLPKADAVVFMMDATALFSKAELEFIHKNFAGKHKRNVFFVVNKINILNEGELETNVKPSVRTRLEKCFTDENGIFDEELYSQRVFFINAYDAFRSKMGIKGKVFVNGQWVEYTPNYEITGVPQYNEAQMRLINSDERLAATFSSALDQLLGDYRESISSMRAKLSAMAMDDAQKAEAKENADKALDEAEKRIEAIESAFEKFAKLAASKLYMDLQQYIDKNIEGEYAAHVESTITTQHYKVLDMMVDGWLSACAILPIPKLRAKVEEIAKKHLQPITDDIVSYVNGKLEFWKTQCQACIQSDLKDLQSEVDDLSAEFELHMDEAISAFYPEEDKPKYTAKGAVQKAILNFYGDTDTQTEIAINNGEIPWSRFVAKTIGQIVVNNAIVAAIGGGLPGLIAMFAIDALIVAVKAKKNAQQKAYNMGAGAIKQLKEEIALQENTIKQDVIAQIKEMGNKFSIIPKEHLSARHSEVELLLAEQQRSVADREAKEKELVGLTSQMRMSIEDLFELIYGKKPSDKEFEALSTNGVVAG